MSKASTIRILKWILATLSAASAAAFAYSLSSTTYTMGADAPAKLVAGRLVIELDAQPQIPHVHSSISFMDSVVLLPSFSAIPIGKVMTFPLLTIAVVLGLTAFGITRLNRKPPPGHCHCGYSLEGNRSGICPECGKHLEETE